MNIEFNLLREPWIVVLDGNATNRHYEKELNLKEAILEAHKYVQLCGELPTQDIAVLRTILAVVQTVVSRYEVDGTEKKLKTPKEALDRWKSYYELGKFPREPFEKYFSEQEDNFNLFDEENRFYQVENGRLLHDPKTKKGINCTRFPSRKLNAVIAESNSKKRLFAPRTEETKDILTYAEAARWLIHLIAFDDAAVKPKDKDKTKKGAGLGWLGKINPIYPVGKTLFDTLMFNTILLNREGELFGEEKPIWENRQFKYEERKMVPVPDNLSELYTTPSRIVKLLREGDIVEGYLELQGHHFDPIEAYNIEPHAQWRFKSKVNKKTKEETFELVAPELQLVQNKDLIRKKQLWRSLPNIILKENKPNKTALSSIWIQTLKENNLLKEEDQVQFNSCGIIYDGNNCSIYEVLSDSLVLSSEIYDIAEDFEEELVAEFNLLDSLANSAGMLDVYLKLSETTIPDTKTYNRIKEEGQEKFYQFITPYITKLLRYLKRDSVEETLKGFHKVLYGTYETAYVTDEGTGEVIESRKFKSGLIYEYLEDVKRWISTRQVIGRNNTLFNREDYFCAARAENSYLTFVRKAFLDSPDSVLDRESILMAEYPV